MKDVDVEGGREKNSVGFSWRRASTDMVLGPVIKTKENPRLRGRAGELEWHLLVDFHRASVGDPVAG